jgi:hypothetical protein
MSFAFPMVDWTLANVGFIDKILCKSEMTALIKVQAFLIASGASEMHSRRRDRAGP